MLRVHFHIRIYLLLFSMFCEGSAIQNGTALLLISLTADSDDHFSTNIVICADMANTFLTFPTERGGQSVFSCGRSPRLVRKV